MPKKIPQEASAFYYPRTSVLKNKYDIQLEDIFQWKAASDTALGHILLDNEPLPERIDAAYLKHVHYCLFKNTYEWAGQTRDTPFTFSDESTGVWPDKGNTVQKNLKSLDQTLSNKNYLKDLPLTEFADSAAELFASCTRTQIFMGGNEYALRVFFVKLAQGAGHKLDFSLLSKARMDEINRAADNNDLEPVKQAFRDISDPERAFLLKEFQNYAKYELKADPNTSSLRFSKEDETLEGTYIECSKENFLIVRGNEHIICKKSHLSPKEFRTLKTGDSLTFAVPKDKDLEQIFIPKEIIPDLSRTEVTATLRRDPFIHLNKVKVQEISAMVYGNSEALHKKMEQIIENPSLGEKFLQKLEESPQSLARLRGFGLFWYKNQERVEAESHIPELITAARHYVNSVCDYEKTLFRDQQEEKARCEQEIEMPGGKLKKLLDLSSKEEQKKFLERQPPLHKELADFVNSVKLRLSADEHKMIARNDTDKLSASLGVSHDKATQIADMVTKTKELHQMAQDIKIHRVQAMSVAS